MAGTGANDFFVSFGSNAPEWAAALSTQLEPAQVAVAHLQSLLVALDAQAHSTFSGVNGALASNTIHPEVLKQLREATGTGSTYTGQSNPKAAALDTALGSAVTSMKDLVAGLSASVKA